MKTSLLVRTCSALTLLALIAVISPARAAEDGDLSAVRACLAHWGKEAPFDSKNPKYRVLSSRVKVLGIGGETRDDVPTDSPELVLIKANVNVLSKAELNLLNPNGWYCLKGQVAVLGKSEVKLHCKANLASSYDGATVMGGSDTDQGVTVLGASRLTRVGGCATK
jgi:hypothetical protein